MIHLDIACKEVLSTVTNSQLDIKNLDNVGFATILSLNFHTVL